MATAASFNDAYRESFDFIAEHVDYASESYPEIIDEIRPLLVKHWAEIARNRDVIPLDPDFEQYATLHRKGVIRIYTARHRTELIGYAVFFAHTHLHYRGTTWAMSDIFWLAPDMRGMTVGRGLFAFAEAALRADGVSVVHVTSKTAHPAAAKLLEALGYELIEVGHAKLLGAG